MYRVATILSSIVLLLLQSGCIVNDDTIATIYCYNYIGNNDIVYNINSILINIPFRFVSFYREYSM